MYVHRNTYYTRGAHMMLLIMLCFTAQMLLVFNLHARCSAVWRTLTLALHGLLVSFDVTKDR